MKVEKVDHFHVYVRDLDKAVAFFSDVLDTRFAGPMVAPAPLNLATYMDPLGIELVADTVPDGMVTKTIDRKGEGLTAICFKVPDLDKAVAELQAKGLKLVGTLDMGNIREAQFHPKDSYGVMIELCEYKAIAGAIVAARGSKRVKGTVVKK